MGDDPADEKDSVLEKAAWKAADRAVGGALGDWWRRLDDGRKTAISVLSAAVILGPLGQGVLAAIKALYSPSIPSAKQLEAVVFLAAITAPVFVGAAIFFGLLGRLATPAVLLVAGGAAFAIGAGVVKTSAPDTLGKVYCYADFRDGSVVYEEDCREFDSLGFAVKSGGPPRGPSDAANVLGWALIYTIDARGLVMVVCGVSAGAAIGYLFRRGP